MTSCPVCYQQNTIFKFVSSDIHGRHIQSPETFKIYYCSDCLAYFPLDMIIDQNYYQKYYSPDYYPPTDKLTKILNTISFFIKSQLITNHFSKSQKIDILDVGCGQGEFLQHLSSKYFNKHGLELNPQAIKLCELKKIKIIGQDINQLKTSQKFDCITLWHVLEHLPDPQMTLNKIFQLLKPGGILVMATPNSQSLGFKFGQKNYFHLDSPRHLFIPNQKTLSLLLKRSNFTNIKYYNPSYDFPLDLFWSIRQSPIRFLIYPLYPLFKIVSSESIMALANKDLVHKNDN